MSKERDKLREALEIAKAALMEIAGTVTTESSIYEDSVEALARIEEIMK